MRVARLEAFDLAAQIRRHLRAEVVGQRQEDLRPQALQERAPRLARERGSQRADALRRDDRNAARLPRQREELLVAGRLVLARRRERLVFVADEQHRAPGCVSGRRSSGGMRLSTARWKSCFSIVPSARARPGFIAIGKLSATTLPCSIRSASGGSGMPWMPSGLRAGIVGVLRRAEGVLDLRVVVEQRQEHADALDDGRAELRLDAHPVVFEPPLDGLELRQLVGLTAASASACSTRDGMPAASSASSRSADQSVHVSVPGLVVVPRPRAAARP